MTLGYKRIRPSKNIVLSENCPTSTGFLCSKCDAIFFSQFQLSRFVAHHKQVEIMLPFHIVDMLFSSSMIKLQSISQVTGISRKKILRKKDKPRRDVILSCNLVKTELSYFAQMSILPFKKGP